MPHVLKTDDDHDTVSLERLTDTSSMPGHRNYFSALDGVRAVAVLLVFWAHLPKVIQPAILQKLLTVAQPGYMGVNLFFVLSGFLITRILLRDREQKVPLRYFYFRRMLRIFPIYYLTLLVVGVTEPSWDLPWCAFYLANYHFAFVQEFHPLVHTWTLSVEEQFYLVWPMMIWFFPPRISLKMVCGVVIPMSVITAGLLVFSVPEIFTAVEAKKLIYFATPCEAGALGLGALLAYTERSGLLYQGYISAAALLVGAIGLAIGIGAKPLLSSTAYDVARLICYALMSFSVVTLAIVRGQSKAMALLRLPIIRSIGRISYGLYLYHLPIFMALKVYPEPEIGRRILLEHSGLAILLSITAAAVSFVFFESPILKLKDRFEFHQQLNPTPQTASA